MLITNLKGIAVLNAIATAPSLAAAAEQLGLSPSAVSKALTRLERDLGARLAVRTTHRLALTETGMLLHERFRNIAAQIEQAESEALDSQKTLRGRLRVQLPTALGRKVIVPRLNQFLKDHPNLEMNVELSERMIDLTKERVEIAVRIGNIVDPQLVAKWLFRMRYIPCASPEYLALNPEPQTPEDLSGHRCLAYFNPDTGRYGDWQFAEKGVVFAKTIAGAVSFNNSESLLETALAGSGIIMIAEFLAAEAIKTNKLRVLLKDYAAPGTDVYALYMPHEAHSPKVRAFMSFLREALHSAGLDEGTSIRATKQVPENTSGKDGKVKVAPAQRGKRVVRSRSAR